MGTRPSSSRFYHHFVDVQVNVCAIRRVREYVVAVLLGRSVQPHLMYRSVHRTTVQQHHSSHTAIHPVMCVLGRRVWRAQHAHLIDRVELAYRL